MENIMRNLNLTVEDQNILLRALRRGMGSVNTIMPMMIDGDDIDAYIMRTHEEGKALDREYERECAERDEEDRKNFLFMSYGLSE